MKSSNMTSSTTIYQVYHGNNSKWGNHSMYNKTFTPNRQSINSNREFVPYLNERDGMNRLLFKKESPRSVPMSPATSDLFRRTSSFRKTEQHNTEGKTIDWGSFKFVPTVIHCPSKVSLRKIISLANMPNSEKIHNSPAFLSTHRRQSSQEYVPPVGSYQVEDYLVRPKTREPTFTKSSKAEIQNPHLTKDIDYYNTTPNIISKSQAILEFGKQTDRSNNFLSKKQWNMFVPKTKQTLGYEFENLPLRKEMIQKDMKRVELSSKMTPKIIPKHHPVNKKGIDEAFKQHKKKYAVNVVESHDIH